MSIEIALAFVTLICWTISELITTLALRTYPRGRILVLSQLLGGVSLLAMAIIFSTLHLSWKALGYFMVLGLLNFSGMFFYYKSLQKRGVALTSPITNACVLVTILLGIFFYQESISWYQILAIAGIVIGIILIAYTKKIFIDRYLGFAIASMFIWGFYLFFLKIPSLLFGAMMVAAATKICTSLFSLPFMLEEKNSWHDGRKLFFFVFWIGILDGLGFWAYNRAIQTATVSIVSPISQAVPLLTSIVGIFLFHEAVNLWQKIGIAIAIAGIISISLMV